MAKTYYSIRDHDLDRYNYSTLNSATKQLCFYDYLMYREQDLTDSEWRRGRYTEEEVEQRTAGEEFDKYSERAKDISINYENFVIDDMSACNFELVEHTKLIPEDF